MTDKADPCAHAPRFPAIGARLEQTAGVVSDVHVDTLLSGDGPVLLEVGSGRGGFALAYVELHPNHRVLALEVRRKYAAILADKFVAMRVRGAQCFAEDARMSLARIGPNGTVARVAIHFPDPWWKKRHAKRMVVNDAFVDQLGRLVAPGGAVFVQTDVDARAQEYGERFERSPWFAAASGGPLVAESPFAPARSNREVRAMQDGLPIYRLLFTRTVEPWMVK